MRDLAQLVTKHGVKYLDATGIWDRLEGMDINHVSFNESSKWLEIYCDGGFTVTGTVKKVEWPKNFDKTYIMVHLGLDAQARHK